MNKIKQLYCKLLEHQKIFLSLVLIYISFFTLQNLQHVFMYQEFGVNFNQIKHFSEHYPDIFKVHTYYLLLPTVFFALLLFNSKPSLLIIGLTLVLLQIFIDHTNTLDLEHNILLFCQEYLGLFKGKMNPQWIKILFWFIFGFLFLLKVCFLKFIKKDKLNINLLFVFLISCVIIGTTFIFHQAIPSGYFKFIKYQKAMEQQNILINPELFNATCKNNKDILCGFIDKENNIYSFDRKIINIPEDKLISEKHFLKITNQNLINEQKDIILNSTPVGQFGSKGFDYSIVSILKTKLNNDNVFIIDPNGMYNYSRHSEIWFTFLTIIAHFIWVNFGLLLLIWHKRNKNQY